MTVKTFTSPRFLVAVVVFEAGLIAGMTIDSFRSVSLNTPASAQIIPDPAAQTMQTNEILRGIDARLAKLTDLAVSGEMKVKVTSMPASDKR